MRPRINYNISVYTESGKLIEFFHSRADLEYWLKEVLWGSNSYLEILDNLKEACEMEVEVPDELTDEEFKVLMNMSEDFFLKYWNYGNGGCQEFYNKIRDCCDGKVETFEGLKWRYNK